MKRMLIVSLMTGLLTVAMTSPIALADSKFRGSDRGQNANDSASNRDHGGRDNRRGDRVRGGDRGQRADHGRGDARDPRATRSQHRDRTVQHEHRRDAARNDWRRDARPTHSYTNRLRYSGDPRPPRVVYGGQRTHRHGWHDNRGRYWQYDRGWYDRYRVQYFRYDRGRYFARDRFSIGIYLAPAGYRSRVWIAGEWLPRLYFSSSRYYINDYDRYALYEPPHWGRWIRVGNDALLIDRDTGEILDVVYDLYW
ncbi:MAG TPA: RcnB family protein [Steroidobacteraceae bacterium]|mgnify:CR=1 FL=1|nr:RcnB family protein [Steroidobacteraceae bacterium]HRX90356.1 RcnB family protein [Steroidobacteraceae bacterium]